MKRPFSMAPVITALVLAFATVSYCASASQKAKDPAEIVMKSCSSCHGIDRVCDKLGTKDRDAWTRTVYGMKQAGARIDENDIPLLAEYLSGLEPGSKPVCK